MNALNEKKTHGYRGQTGGCQMGGEFGEWDEEAQIGSYESQGLECSIGYVVGVIVRVVDGC